LFTSIGAWEQLSSFRMRSRVVPASEPSLASSPGAKANEHNFVSTPIRLGIIRERYANARRLV
jgi:hypothetical protein